MFWKTKEKQTVPATWKVGDELRANNFVSPLHCAIQSISPDRTEVIVKDTSFGGLYSIDFKDYENTSLLSKKIEDWSEYNKALLELQKQFGI